jgi:hypothetical protein
MTTPTPTRLPGDPIPPPPQPRYPWRVGVTMLGLVVLVLVVVWLAFQALKGPPTAGQFPSPATATAIERNFEATVSAADTAQPRPTTRPTTQPATQPTAAPTRAPTALAAPVAAPEATPQIATTVPRTADQVATTQVAAATSAPTPAAAAASQAEPARTATVAPAGTTDSATETPAPTVAPELAAEVSAAYARYWQVLADADYSNDPSALEQVAAGEQLATLQNNIAEDQSLGRATRVRVQHSFAVASVHDNQAEVDDHLQDLSVFVDPNTHNPLAGEVEPSSVDAAPAFDAIFQLQLLDGTWKVTSAARVRSGS